MTTRDELLREAVEALQKTLDNYPYVHTEECNCYDCIILLNGWTTVAKIESHLKENET